MNAFCSPDSASSFVGDFLYLLLSPAARMPQTMAVLRPATPIATTGVVTRRCTGRAGGAAWIFVSGGGGGVGGVGAATGGAAGRGVSCADAPREPKKAAPARVVGTNVSVLGCFGFMVEKCAARGRAPTSPEALQ